MYIFIAVLKKEGKRMIAVLNDHSLKPVTSFRGNFSALAKSEMLAGAVRCYLKETKQLIKLIFVWHFFKLTFLSPSFGSALRDCVRLFTGLVDGAES